MKLLYRFWGLNWADRYLVIETAILVVLVRVGLWVSPYRMLRRVLRGMGSLFPFHHSVEQIIWAVSTVSYYVPKASCLTQALAADTLLRANGVPVSIQFGVSKNNQNVLEAHAWVESQGRVLLGASGLERFTPLCHQPN